MNPSAEIRRRIARNRLRREEVQMLKHFEDAREYERQNIPRVNARIRELNGENHPLAANLGQGISPDRGQGFALVGKGIRPNPSKYGTTVGHLDEREITNEMARENIKGGDLLAEKALNATRREAKKRLRDGAEQLDQIHNETWVPQPLKGRGARGPHKLTFLKRELYGEPSPTDKRFNEILRKKITKDLDLWKKGQLHSGKTKKHLVTDKRQAEAIAYSQAQKIYNRQRPGGAGAISGMGMYCIGCRGKTEDRNMHHITAKNGKQMKKASCVHCGKTKTSF